MTNLKTNQYNYRWAFGHSTDFKFFTTRRKSNR